MNQDYHYSATFLASRRAGFSEEDSNKIAWAALMVDEMTKEQYKKMDFQDYKAEITGYKYCRTMAIVLDMAPDFIHNYSFKESGVSEKEMIGFLEDTVQSEFEQNTQIEREIWIPFHFLPGNLRKITDDKKNEVWKYRYEHDGVNPTRSFDEVWDEKDFACMCFPNSELAEEMVKDTHKVFHKESYCKEFKLMLLGIRMYVLADTWAHQGFTGSRNYWCNHADNVKGTSREPAPAAAWSLRYHSLGYLGHLKMGHLPDQGFRKYSYNARWREERIDVDNVTRFSNALAQMYNALKFIQCEEPCSQVKSENGCLTDTQTCYTCLDLYISRWNIFEDELHKSPTGNKMVEDMKELIKVAKDVLRHDPGDADGDQIKFWEEVPQISLNTYEEAKNINKDLYNDYASAAAYHRKWVMREVNRRLKCINPEWKYFTIEQEWR